MLLLRKEIMVDAGKMLELEARCPGDRRYQYPRADQAVQGKGEQRRKAGRGENDDQGQAKCGRGR
jgi:hypothetical protein